MKKYFYVSILLGAFALSGCTDDEADNKEVKDEPLNTEQSIEINNEANTTKIVEAAPIPLNLTQEEKAEYYQKYVEILEKVNEENNEAFELEMEPITAFLDENWIEVADFEKLAKERANMSITVLENSEGYSPGAVPKTVMLQIGSKVANIIFEGSFDTQLNSNTPEGIQLFSAFNGISSEAENADGNWTQFGNVALLKDGGVTYVIEVSGKYSQSGIISTHTMALKFNCNKYGAIS
ncbi:hypothetical protein CSE16_10130 [Solibacillus sp. R5-41]|uniref:hypothetical protein n=1 Tax=Solibacillus sp. R5-41 TaxID=2048654 RepID=UPI000C1284C7|nr:hypothetical protein [Solibacillus sp. R5-41]ATP40375.1 hypothetical protein CSE16_10130 [Solibacillus sp. R5-41]